MTPRGIFIHILRPFVRIRVFRERDGVDMTIIEGPLSYKYIMTSVDVYESIHHKIITC